ncbi:WD40 repeat, partial [Candidatus Electrothrix marina]
RVRHIFLKLVRPGQGTEDTRQAATFEEFKPEYHGLIKKLADRRLLVTGQTTENQKNMVEVVHEALILHWTTLREWVDKERSFLEWREKLKVLRKQWEKSKEEDQGESALLRGPALHEALDWRASHTGHLGKKELHFIEDSKAAWIKQRKRRNIIIAAVLLITVLGAVVFFLLWKNAEQQKTVAEQKTVEANIEKDRADEQRERAEKQTLEARHNLAKAFEGKALTALKTAKQEGTWAYKQTALFTAASLGQKIDPQQPSWLPSPLAILFNAEVFHNALTEQWSSPVQQGAVRSVAFSPDGRRIASASDDKMVRIWDSTTGKEIFLLQGHTDSVWSVAFSPDGQYIASASRDKTIRIWEATSGKNLLIIQEKEKIHLPCIAFSPSGKGVAATSSGFAIRIWDVETGKELTILKGDGQATGSIAFSPDGQLLASTHNGGKIRIWNATSGQEVNSLTGHTAYEIRSVAFSPDGKTLATASWDFKFSIDNTVRLWDVNTGKELNVLKGHTNAVLSIAFSPHGKYIASASADRTIRIWDVETGTELKLLKGSDAAVSVAYNPDGSQLISAFLDNTVRVWDVNINKERKILSGHTDDIRSISFSPDSKTLASASGDKTVRIWDVVTGEEKFTLQGGHAAVRIVLFSPDGKRVASASWDHTQRVWDSKTGNVIKILKGHPSGICKIFFTADGNKLISYWSNNGHDMEGIWDITGAGLSVQRSKWDCGRGINFSPDRSITASIYNVNENHNDRGVVKVMNNKTGEKINVLDGHKDTVWNISFSSDSKRIVSASEDKTVRIWDVATGKEQFSLKGHLDSVSRAVFSPNGQMVASASRDKTVRIWNSGTGKEMNVFIHPDAVYTVAFSPDSRFLASGAEDKIVRLWDMRPYTLFLHNSKPTPLYHTFIKAVKFLWQLDVHGLEIVETNRRTPADLKKYSTLLAPPPPGQSKFDQVLEWAEKQQEK